MRLYHGTDLLSAKDICVNGIDLSKSRKHIDFGRGFYLTDDYFTAKKWAKHKALQRNSDPTIINVDFDFVSAKKHIKFFKILNENYSLQYAFHTSFSKSFIVINGYTKL